jgi:hypothetical protein
VRDLLQQVHVLGTMKRPIPAPIIGSARTRFQAPPEIRSGPMLVVAAIGLVVNLISMKLLAGGSTTYPEHFTGQRL